MPSESRRRLLKAAAVAPLMRALTPAAAQETTGAGGLRVAVVGAGAFGGWTALHLLRRGAGVTLLDAWGAGHSRASSGGESRVIRGIYGPDRIYVDLVRRSLELWRASDDLWGQRFYHRTGALWMLGGDDSYVRESLPLLSAAGLRVDELSPADAAARYRQVRFDGVEKIYYEHEAGYLLARRACEAVRQAFVAEGGDYRQSAVRPGRVAGGRMEALALSDGTRLEADAYVFACGPWLGELLPDVVGDRVAPSRQEVYYFGTPAGDASFAAPSLPCWVDFGSRLFYGIPGAESRGFKIADDTRGEPFDPTRGSRVPTLEGVERARSFLRRRFPALAGAPLVEARVCQYENSPDGHYIVDRHPGAHNVWIAGGGSGHGFKVGPALGERIAGMVTGEGGVEPFFSLSRLASAGSRSTQLGTER